MVLGLSTAYAGLIDRGNGLIYDDVQDITWMADANYAITEDYGITHTDGRMTWDNAVAWAGLLDYGGYDDWRLFNAAPDDTGCSYNTTPAGYPTQYYGYECTQNELGHLFYNDLGLTRNQSILDGNTTVLALFDNVQSHICWPGVEYAPNTDDACYFLAFIGLQGYDYKTNTIYSCAVRSGDVAVPEPASLLLLLSGLLGMRGIRVIRQRL